MVVGCWLLVDGWRVRFGGWKLDGGSWRMEVGGGRMKDRTTLPTFIQCEGVYFSQIILCQSFIYIQNPPPKISSRPYPVTRNVK